MHVLSAGDGYTYYTSEVATGDARRDHDRELGDYYTADGNPPGRWMGGGAAVLGVAGTVTEEQMKALFGEGLHPDADRIIAEAIAEGKTAKQAQEAAKLGRSYYAYKADENSLQGRIQAGYATFQRIHGHEPNTEERRLIRSREGAQAFRDAKGREPADKEELGRYITAATRPDQQAVAGFDLVCSPAKSVSVLWALGDDDTRKSIEQAQDRAVASTIAYLEREALATRAGTNGVEQIEVEGGVAVTAFRHFESRNGDPQLHDHLVVANKVKGSDGNWRTIDSKLLHRMNVPISEFYNAAIMSEVTKALDVTTEARTVAAGKRPVMEIAGVDTDLLETFSSRSASIRVEVERLTAEYQRDHGRAPDTKTQIKIAQGATLETRPQKERGRSPQATHDDAVARVGQDRADQVLPAAQRIAQVRARDGFGTPTVDVDERAALVLATVEDHYAVWGAGVVEAEARRQLAQIIPDQDVAEPLVQQVAKTALQSSVSLTPPSPHGAFKPLTRSSGESVFEHKGKTVYTSGGILQAEDELLQAARYRKMAPVSRDVFERVAAASTGPLDAGQRDLARTFATSDVELVAGIGPAGAGKTTALKLANEALTVGGVRMIGLAPSAPAAAVLSEAVGIEATTIHGFLAAHEQDDVSAKYALEPGDVIVVDEAGMAGTKRLRDVTMLAQEHGAFVRLIGDDRQLSAVEAGGALRLIDREVGSVQLEHVHRFADAEEAEASLRLRDPLRPGDPFSWYQEHARVVGGDSERMTAAVFEGWQQDTLAGTRSLMLAPTATSVADLNARAQAFRISTGDVDTSRSVPLRDGLAAHVGDTIVTRRNDSDLRIQGGRDRVKNGDLWTVTGIRDNGALDVAHAEHGAVIQLPAGYVAQHVEVGYARTISRSQGLTTEHTHVLGDATMSREDAYTALSRGKESNRLYLALDDAATVPDALEQIAARSERLLSAHETIRAEQDRVEDLVTLIDQHADVATRADELRAGAIVTKALGVDLATSLEGQESWGALAASLRHAEDYGHDPVQTLRDAYGQRELATADDVPAVLYWRIEQALEGIDQPVVRVVDREPVDGVPAWIADGRRHQDELLPAEWRDHLAERHHYIGVRLKERGAVLALEQPAWTQQLGRLPSEPWRMFDWHRTAAEVDVLRTKYRIDPSEPQAIPDTLRGNPVADHLQERVTALHKAAALSTAPEVTVATREHYATHAAEQTAVARTALVAAAEGVQQATSTAVATAADVVAETSTETAAATAPQASTAEAAPAATTVTQTTPVASVSPTTAQEGTIMSDPIDDTLENVGRHAGRSGQTIASETARQIQRANDERRRALQDAQRKADRDREQAVRDAQRKAEREKEQADREAAREQERTARLERRYPTTDADRQQDPAAAAATGAVLGAAAADAIENATDRDTAAIAANGRDDAQAATEAIESETAAVSADEPAAPAATVEHVNFDEEDRQIMFDAGLDPDEPSTGSDMSSSSFEQFQAPDLSRGDDSLER
ncbi:MobF family relaxase [Curtobacterium poinsettiae]|uniref:MobF family relaxase n=1 Tax=Curtobacterium poinsettiae TaxID=159612 RepID=UPI00235E360B|nr:MobF family relaxase [Curtobacterium flaccumfaciens]MDD1386898.1 MobF family relaxase [Curtobacterium flaccumfaciens pv. poinsettiae]